jgi:hypothetical protein
LGEEYRSLSSSLCFFSPLPCYLVPLSSKCFPQHPILQHPQPTLLSQCEGPSFTLVLSLSMGPIHINFCCHLHVSVRSSSERSFQILDHLDRCWMSKLSK